jgi:hypothetical protein
MNARRLSRLVFASLLAPAAMARADDPRILPADDSLPPDPPPFVPPPPIPNAPWTFVSYTPPSQPRTAYRVEGGATFSTVYDIPIRGAEITGGVGTEFVHGGAAYLTFTFFGGTQETGLAAFHVQVNGDLEARLGHVRIGIGASAGYLGLVQAVGPGNLALAPTIGAFGFLSVDVVQWGGPRACDTQAVYVQGRLRGDIVVGGDGTPGLWGPSFGVGVRF